MRNACRLRREGITCRVSWRQTVDTVGLNCRRSRLEVLEASALALERWAPFLVASQSRYFLFSGYNFVEKCSGSAISRRMSQNLSHVIFFRTSPAASHGHDVSGATWHKLAHFGLNESRLGRLRLRRSLLPGPDPQSSLPRTVTIGVAGRWYQQLTRVECGPYDLRQLRQLLFFQSILQHF